MIFQSRERWRGSDKYIKQFKDDPVQGWNKRGEEFRKWSRSEIQTMLEILSKLPSWLNVEDYFFRRANLSIHKNNPATSELTQKTIIFYDKFFTEKNKLIILGHEASHFKYQKLSIADIAEFEELSGWDIEVKDRKIYLKPPKNPIKPDSVIDMEEDFLNHAEMYISNPKKLKKINPRMYDFFLKRFPQ